MASAEQIGKETNMLNRLAEEELLGETRRAAVRASVAGAAAWKKCPLPKTNKAFLHNTIIQHLSANKHRDQRSKRTREYIISRKLSPTCVEKCIKENKHKYREGELSEHKSRRGKSIHHEENVLSQMDKMISRTCNASSCNKKPNEY